ncbi:PilT/PilU family type 4a pilus ATPase [Egicoccus sp. AB-alg2]|uniref:PilT/PilU family type 4a pilus ATPase n=1 Tax=Egicoccus sp. AB-alg2 TaxID=3242693 RepID=UPI00359F02CE
MSALGEVLVRHGVLSPEQLRWAEERSAAGEGSLPKVLLDQRLAGEGDLVRALAATLGMPYAEVDAAHVDPHAAALLPGEIARELLALPIRFGEDDQIMVAVADPYDTTLRARLESAMGLPVALALASRRTLLAAIEAQAVPAGVGARGGEGSTAGALSSPPAVPSTPPPGGTPAMAAVDGGAAVGGDGASAPVTPLLMSEEDTAIDLDQLLLTLVERGGSDLHLTCGIPPTIRVHGDLTPMEEFPVCVPDELQKMLYSIMTQKQREQFENELELDMSYAIPGKSRFRVNVFMQRDSIGAVMRVIPFEIRPLEQLGIPEQVANFAYLPRGFVLVTGPTGSGKSTTLASVIDLVNRNRPSHIMTVEDPIEFLHTHKRSVVNQREVGTDTHGFNAALKHVLRQDPDVILVGEMRDLETIQIALTAAETGHLVFGTLHTQDAPQSVDRIIDVFPPHQQEQIRVMLAGALQGVVCQTLLKTADGKGRAVAVEIMTATSAVRNLIREGKTHQLYSAIQAGAQHGMVAMDQSLATLVKAGKVTYDAALEKANNVAEFQRLSGKG